MNFHSRSLILYAFAAATFPAAFLGIAAPVLAQLAVTVPQKAAKKTVPTTPLTAPPVKVAPVALEKIVPEGGDAGSARAKVISVDYEGKTQEAAELTFFHHERAFHAIYFPIDGLDPDCNTLTFKAKLNVPEEQLNEFEISLVDNERGNSSTQILKHTTRLDNGWYSFKWDVVHDIDRGGGLNLSKTRRIVLAYPLAKVPADNPIVLTLTDVQFVSGYVARIGDPELFQQWKKYISDYKPDYSDSSKYLLPPTTGRITTPLPLTVDGKAYSKIIVPAGASDPLKLAGTELQHWIKEMSGANVTIISAPDKGNGTRVLLGRQFAAGKFDKDIASLRDTDGFAVRTAGKNIHVFGATDKGTLNGIFAFLENNTDIIWPRPQTELSAVFTPNPNLRVLWANALERPATKLRGWTTNMGLRPETEIWEVRNRDNYPKGGGYVTYDATRRKAQGSYIEFGGGHNISTFLGKDRPERFYPVIDGQKVATFDIWKHQPNFTAPDIVDVVAKNVLKFIEEDAPPLIDCININIEDSWGVSTDPKSLEPIKLADGALLKSDDPAFRSTQFFQFLNAVTEKINAVHPNMMVGTYAYFFSATAPKVAIDPHIRVYFAPYPRPDYRSPLSSPINARWWSQLTAFAKMTPNLVIREYYGIINGGRPLAEVVKFDVKSYLALGVKEYTAEMNPDEEVIYTDDVIRGDRQEWNFMAMDFWIINRIYWNPNQDIEQLRKYYLRRTYREAAPEMEKFFGILRANSYQDPNPSGFEYGQSIMSRYVIGPGHESEMRQLLVDAATAVKNPVSRMSVDVLAKTFDDWLAVTKATPEQKTAIWQRTTAQVLHLGWLEGINGAWASSTVINRDGKTIPVVRLMVNSDHAIDKDVGIYNTAFASLTSLQKGDTLSFVMTPFNVPKTVKPLQLILTAKDANSIEIKAPTEAFTTLPDGGVKVQWKLTSPEGAFDSTQIKRMNLVIPSDVLGTTPEATYYITDWSLEQSAPGG